MFISKKMLMKMCSPNRPKPQIKVHPKSWQYPLINYLIVIQVSTSQLLHGKIELEALLFYNIKIFKYWKHPFLPCKLFVPKIFLKKEWKHCQSVSKSIGVLNRMAAFSFALEGSGFTVFNWTTYWSSWWLSPEGFYYQLS